MAKKLSLVIAAALALTLAAPKGAQADPFREFGRAVKSGAKEVGHAVKDGAKEVGQAVKSVFKGGAGTRSGVKGGGKRRGGGGRRHKR